MCRILQKFFLFGLAIVAAVNADVSQLFNNGYNYPQPAPTFQDQQSLPIEAPATPPAPVPTQAPVKVHKRNFFYLCCYAEAYFVQKSQKL